MRYEKKQDGGARLARKAISLILSFLLFIFSCVIALLCCVYLNIFDPQSMAGSLSSSGYFASAKDQFETNAWDISIPLGVPQSVVQELVSEEKVTADIKDSLKAAVDNTEFTADTKGITSELDKRVKDYFTELSDEQLSVLEDYKEAIAAEYVKLTTIPLVKYIGSVKNAYSEIFLFIVTACAVLLIADVIFLMKLHRYRHRALRYVSYAAIASALGMAVVPFIGFVTGFYKKFNITPGYFKGFVTAYVEDILIYMLLCAAFFALAAFLLITGTVVARRKLLRHKV